MSRFSKLELDATLKKEKEDALSQPIEEGFDAVYYFQKAEELFNLGEYEQSLRYYSRALSMDNSLVSAWVGQVRGLIKLGEYREAEIWANKGLEFFKDDPGLIATKAVIYSKFGLYKEAIALSDASLAQKGKPLNSYLWLARGEIFLAKGSKNASFCFDKAIELSKDSWACYQEVGLIYLEAKYYSKALQYLKEAAARYSVSPYLWLKIGFCYQRLGFSKQARESFEQALKLNPTYKPALRAYSKINRASFISKLFSWCIGSFRR